MKIEKISEVLGSKVYTDSGDFFGEVEEANLLDNKIDSWKIRIGGTIVSALGGARGVIIPHQFVRSIGDVFIISKSALPNTNDSIEEIPEDLV
jgi:sporulation protein YlmC with PRC-barrel domain